MVSGAGTGLLGVGSVHARYSDGGQGEVDEGLYPAGSHDPHLDQMVSNPSRTEINRLAVCIWEISIVRPCRKREVTYP